MVVIVREFYSNYSYSTSDLRCHSILMNLEIKGNHEYYASVTMLKQFLVTSYRLFILISISRSFQVFITKAIILPSCCLLIDTLKVINN